MATKASGEVDKVAGGLVWVNSFDGQKIVIVQKKGKTGEWALPKGPLEKNYDWTDAAKTNVAKETQCKTEDLRIEGEAVSISYSGDGKPKIVLFFNMTCVSDYEFKDTENNEVRLVTVNEALALLNDPKECLLIREIDPLFDLNPVKLLWLRKMFKSYSHRRLHETIGPFELELKRTLRENNGRTKTAFQSLEYSKRALSFGEIEVGWRFLFQAELEQAALITDAKLRESAALITLNEAEDKLKSWRLKVVQDLLGKDGKLKGEITADDLYKARKILQEQFTNMYIKLRTAGFQLGLLTLIAIALVIPLVFVLPAISAELSLSNKALVIAIMIYGALGGAFSGIFSISRQAGKIPEHILSSWVTLARPVVGVIAALAISGFLLSGLIQLGSLTAPLILAVSFAVGFSERLLVIAIEKTGG